MSWVDVTVGDIIEISNLSKDLTPTELLIERVLILDNIDLYSVNENELDKAKREYSWFNSPLPVKASGFNFNKITWGQFIDLNKFTSVPNPLVNLDKIVAVIEGYDDFATKCRDVQKQNVIKPYSLMNDFLKHNNKVIENYDDLFSDGDSEEEDDDLPPQPIEEKVASRWAWESMTYKLANGDITKVPAILGMSHIMVLNWITMIKDLKLSPQS